MLDGKLFGFVGVGLVLASCSPAQPSDAGVDDVRNLRDGTVNRPYFDSSAPADVITSDVPDPSDVPTMTDVQPTDVADTGVVVDTGVDVPSPPPTTNVRFVHAVPPGMSGPPPAVDFCVRRAGTMDALQGPLLSTARGGGGPGLSPLQVTRYFSLPAGRIDVIFVDGMARDCTTPLPLPALNNLDVGGANGYRTVVVSGVPLPGPDGGPQPFPFEGRVIADNAPNSLMGMGATAIRVFNAIPSPQRLDLGIVVGMSGNPSDLITLFFNVGFGEVGRPPPMGDAGQGTYPNGYYGSTPIAAPGVTIGLRAHCTAAPCGPITAVPNVTTDAGSITTAFLALQLRGSPMPAPTPIAIFCRDHLPPVSGLSQCAVLPM